MPSKMGPEARKILNRWARCEFYIYMRPTSSKFVQPKEKPGIYWVVSVEWRAPGFDAFVGPNIKPPQLKRMTDRNLMWLAGIIEGEGSFVTSKTNPKSAPLTSHVQVSMTDKDTIDRVMEMTGCGRIHKSVLKSGKDFFMWKLTTKNDAFRLACLLYPEMSYRRKAQIRKCFGISEDKILRSRDRYHGEWRVRRAEGRDLDEVIRRLDLEVPKSRPRNRINQNEQPGWCAPEKMKKRAVAEARKRRTQGGYASGGKKVSDLKPPPKGAGAGVNPKKRKKAKK